MIGDERRVYARQYARMRTRILIASGLTVAGLGLAAEALNRAFDVYLDKHAVAYVPDEFEMFGSMLREYGTAQVMQRAEPAVQRYGLADVYFAWAWLQNASAIACFDGEVPLNTAPGASMIESGVRCAVVAARALDEGCRLMSLAERRSQVRGDVEGATGVLRLVH